jgi:hypothetical protein
VLHVVSRASAPDGYVATVHIESDGTLLADWHLPAKQPLRKRWPEDRGVAHDPRIWSSS